MTGQHRGLQVICPRCGKKGFLTRRWTRGSYFVKYSSAYEFEPGYRPGHSRDVRIYEYTGKEWIDEGNQDRVYEYVYVAGGDGKVKNVKFHLALDRFDNKTRIPHRISQVLGRTTYRFYVGHYDAQKMKQQSREFKEGKIKTRPNGRTWCLLKRNPHHFIKYGGRDMLIEHFYEIISNLSVPN